MKFVITDKYILLMEIANRTFYFLCVMYSNLNYYSQSSGQMIMIWFLFFFIYYFITENIIYGYQFLNIE